MRETWVPFFQDIRQSSMWAYDAETFKVWMTLLTMVDPEGFICAAIPGIAIASGIPIAKVREAMATFEDVDPDSRSQEHDGRRLERVPRGWRMLNFEAHKERARHEADKARKRRWARANRAASNLGPANDLGEGGDTFADSCAGPECVGCVDPFCAAPHRSAPVAPRSETVDASKSKSKSKSGGEEERPSPTGYCEGQDAPDRGPQRAVYFTLDGWEPSETLRTDARIAGVPAEVFDQRVAGLRNGPIGGSRGVFDRDAYVRRQFPKWRAWHEQEQAGQSRGGGGGAPVAAPQPQRPRVPGMPAWVTQEHAELARTRRGGLRAAVKAFATGYHLPVPSLRPADLIEPFRKYLEALPPIQGAA